MLTTKLACSVDARDSLQGSAANTTCESRQDPSGPTARAVNRKSVGGAILVRENSESPLALFAWFYARCPFDEVFWPKCLPVGYSRQRLNCFRLVFNEFLSQINVAGKSNPEE